MMITVRAVDKREVVASIMPKEEEMVVVVKLAELVKVVVVT